MEVDEPMSANEEQKEGEVNQEIAEEQKVGEVNQAALDTNQAALDTANDVSESKKRKIADMAEPPSGQLDTQELEHDGQDGKRAKLSGPENQ